MEEVNERTKLKIDFQNNVAADSNKEKDGADAVCKCSAPDFKLGSDGKSCDEGMS